MSDFKITPKFEALNAWLYFRLKKALHKNNHEKFSKIASRYKKILKQDPDTLSLLFSHIENHYKKNGDMHFLESFYNQGFKGGATLNTALGISTSYGEDGCSFAKFLDVIQKNEKLTSSNLFDIFWGYTIKWSKITLCKDSEYSAINTLKNIIDNHEFNPFIPHDQKNDEFIMPYKNHLIKMVLSDNLKDDKYSLWDLACVFMDDDLLSHLWSKKILHHKGFEHVIFRGLKARGRERNWKIGFSDEIIDGVLGMDGIENIIKNEVIEEGDFKEAIIQGKARKDKKAMSPIKQAKKLGLGRKRKF